MKLARWGSLFVLAAVFGLPAGLAFAVSFDDDDFLVTFYISGTIEVFDANFTHKGRLADVPSASAMTMTPSGTVLVSGSHGRLVELDSNGVLVNELVHPDVFSPTDLAVSMDGRIFDPPFSHVTSATRGPGGDVLATSHFLNTAYRWSESSTQATSSPSPRQEYSC